MKVLLDTNALLLPHQFGIDIFSEIGRLVPEKHDIFTLRTVVDELVGIAKSSTTDDGVAARVGLMLLKDKGVGILPSQGTVDDAIVDFAINERAIVCTNDVGIRNKLKESGLKVLCMRGKKRMARI
jgi:uncharacterized protein